MDRYGLAAVMKEVGNFDMDSFPGRRSFQKAVCLLHSFGVYLGYGFGWYLHGTYSPALTRDGLAIRYIVENVPGAKPRFKSPSTQDCYDRFKEFVEDKKDDPALLEIGASICYLGDKRLQKDRILKLIENKKNDFTEEQCVLMWDELEKYGVVEA